MRHWMLVAATLLAGCASGQSNDSAGSSEGNFTAVTRLVCPQPATPNSLDDLTKLDSCELKALFEGELAKQNTSDTTALANGAYDGIPLCRKDIIPDGSALPPRIRSEIHGENLLMGLLKVSDHATNGFAGKIWHGKEFTLPANATKGSVLNFIDIQSDGINETTRKAAEAVHSIDPDNRWMVLDYKDAFTGVEGVFEGVSVQLIKHVYDTARLVNKEQNIYLGMAWLVNTPGVYEPGTANTVPSCYFALKKKT
jgi:hypothetical protein